MSTALPILNPCGLTGIGVGVGLGANSPQPGKKALNEASPPAHAVQRRNVRRLIVSRLVSAAAGWNLS